jgi:hypothetical protein
METKKKQNELAESKMNELLAITTIKGGYDKLTKKELSELIKYTQIGNAYEDEQYKITMPQTLIF